MAQIHALDASGDPVPIKISDIASGGGITSYNIDGSTPKTEVTTLTSEVELDVPDYTAFGSGAVVDPDEIRVIAHAAGHLATTVFITPIAKTTAAKVALSFHGVWVTINLDNAAHALAVENGGEYIFCPVDKTTRIDMREEITSIRLTAKDSGAPANQVELGYS